MTDANDRHVNDYDILMAVGILIVGILLFIYAIFFTTGPSPNLTLQDFEIYAFNVSTANSTLTSNLQITIFYQNPNIGIRFEEVEVYVSYNNQQITPKTLIPNTYIGPWDVTVWSPHLNGTTVLADPNLAASLAEDIMNAGVVLLIVKVTGRWRSDDIASYHRMKVICWAYVTFGKKTNDNVIASFIKLVEENCHVEIPSIVSKF
ncbi:hypothetical protein SSX86_021706 [Deinandra increscens subsp. villosa]|uniref:Late embryogenesis abundant protein LEA-2 subgroup domain-containing protein n=1 Tax=Deinandra increscens subsp. villosa TaxID=3103831 RepID=A0AAP0CRT5_9ASTR